MINWKKTTLKEISTEIAYGYTASANFEKIGPKFLRITDIVPYFVDYNTVPCCKIDNKKHNQYKLEKGDILIARTGATTGYNYLFDDDLDAVFASYLIRFRLNHEIVNPYFIKYVLKSREYMGFINNYISGAAQPGINAPTLGRFSFKLPPIQIQGKIANILSNYDTLIKNNNERISILEEMVQKFYKEWFIDFNFPGKKTSEFKDSEIGKIPKNWDVKPIEKLLKYQIGGGWGNENSGSKFSEKAFVIRGADIPSAKHGDISKCPLRYHTKSNLQSRLLEENDIVFEVSGGSKGQPVGRSLLLNKHLFKYFDENVICASFCKLIRVDENKILPEYIYMHLLNIYNNGEIEKYQTQSTGIINFKFTFFLEHERILIPEKFIQEEFKKIIRPIFDEISLLGNKNEMLKQTRDLLLPRLISGEINIGKLEIL